VVTADVVVPSQGNSDAIKLRSYMDMLLPWYWDALMAVSDDA
jgi:hypothetical protein